MLKNLGLFEAAGRLSQHASASRAIIARNIAHADTPGYRAVAAEPFTIDQHPSGLKATREGHLSPPNMSDMSVRQRQNPASPNGNTVSLEEEMVASVEAQKAHDQALAIYRHGLNILRTPLGRR